MLERVERPSGPIRSVDSNASAEEKKESPVSPLDHFGKDIFREAFEKLAKRSPSKKKKPSAASQPSIPSSHRLASDVTVEELYKLRQDQTIKYVLVVFHASWCKPCQVLATPEYQGKIQTFNRDHPNMRFVTMDVGDKNDHAMLKFVKAIGLPGVPWALFIRNRDGRYHLGTLTQASSEDPFRLKSDPEGASFDREGVRKLPAHSPGR